MTGLTVFKWNVIQYIANPLYLPMVQLCVITSSEKKQLSTNEWLAPRCSTLKFAYICRLGPFFMVQNF